MDTKGWIVVVLCAVGMIFYFPYMQRDMARERVAPTPEAAENSGEAKEGGVAKSGAAAKAPGTADKPGGAKATEAVKEETAVLRSEKAEFHMTNFGGGISEATLLEHTNVIEGDGFVTLNRSGSYPVGTLGGGDDEADLGGYEITKQRPDEVIFEKVNAEGIRVTKCFNLNPPSAEDGYVVNLEVRFKNEDSRSYRRDDLWLYTGALEPLHTKEWPQQTGFFWRDADKMRYKDVNYFKESAGFLGFFSRTARNLKESEDLLNWAGVMDQFFAIVIADQEPRAGSVWARHKPIALEGAKVDPKRKLFAAEGGIGLPEVRLAPGEVESFSYELYLGPKEYKRLVDLGNDRREIMNYGNFPLLGGVVKHVSRFLMKALVSIKGAVGNYGVAIIIITIMIRLVIWPLHAKSTRTMKRMAALSPMMTEMKEKYKDDPQKLNTEMMQLYRDYGVNPMGGCLPVFLQLPIFLGFYQMLQSAVELRHEGLIWWVDDLSMPDTVWMIPLFDGVPLNVLPLLMAVTMVLQMKVAPKSGDQMQQRIFMFMPLIFLFICYNFASALALYWTTQNIFSIGQTYYMSRRPEPELQKVSSKKGGMFSDMMQQAKDRTKNMEKGPQQTKSKADQKKKRRK